MPATATNERPKESAFAGFESLDANYIYCPNQFFDVCLRHCSRGAVRIIAFVLVETLRWRDKDGNPIQQDIEVSYNTLIERANISRGALAKYLKEAVDLDFLQCTREARPKTLNQSAQTATYALNWDHAGRYTTDRDAFAGFFAGEGNRSPIPLEYFTHVIPYETLAITKIVGAVLRHTIGYANQFGRRPQAALSYTKLQSYTGIKDRTTISQAIQRSLEMNYIARTEEGCFDSDSTRQRSATYAVKWLTNTEKVVNGSKTRPAEQSNNPTRVSVQKTDQRQFKNPTSNGSESRPAERFKKQTIIKKQSKETTKQQGAAVSLLMQYGFSEGDALSIASTYSPQEIQQQVDWLPYRDASTNPTGMLRRAIEGDWSEPAKHITQRTNAEKVRAVVQDDVVTTQEEVSDRQRLKQRTEQKKALHRERMRIWRESATKEMKHQWYQAALKAARTDVARERIHNANPNDPPVAVLAHIPVPDSASLPNS